MWVMWKFFEVFGFLRLFLLSILVMNVRGVFIRIGINLRRRFLLSIVRNGRMRMVRSSWRRILVV